MKKIAVSICLLFSFAACGQGYAETLTLVAPQYPPHVYADGTNPIGASGAAVEIVAEALHRMGYDFKCKVLPWSRGMYLVEQGEADGIMLAYSKYGRERILEYCRKELYSDRMFLFSAKVPPGNEMSRRIEKRIGVVLGYSYGPVMDAALQKKQFGPVIEFYTQQELIAALLDGKVDLMPSDYDVAFDMVKSMGKPDALTAQMPMVEAVPMYVAFSRLQGLSGVRESLDAILGQMHEDGTIAMIQKRFFRKIDASK